MRSVHAGCRRIFGETSVVTRLVGGPTRLGEYLRYLTEGHDRYSRYLSSRRKAAQGSIVIYDRYPLNAVQIFNRAMDGPRIAAKANGHMGAAARTFAHLEDTTYRKILPAEHVFVLHVSPDVSQSRKPEHKRVLIEAKSQAIKQVERDKFSVIDIDADQPLDQVLLEIKSALWRLL